MFVIVPLEGQDGSGIKLPDVFIGIRLLQLATGAKFWALFKAFVLSHSTVLSNSLGVVTQVAGAGGLTVTVVDKLLPCLHSSKLLELTIVVLWPLIKPV